MRKEVTELCARCENEAQLQWDIEKDGFEAHCPYCGDKLMLCSECPDHGECDWDTESKMCHMCTEVRHAALRKDQLRKLAYERYKLDWCISHGVTMADIVERVKVYMLDDTEGRSFEEYVADSVYGMDRGGSMWVSYGEFISTEYLVPEYIKTLLRAEEYADYLKLEGIAHSASENQIVVQTPCGDIIAESKGNVDYPGIDLFIRNGTTPADFEPGCMLEYHPGSKQMQLHVYQSGMDIDPSQTIILTAKR